MHHNKAPLKQGLETPQIGPKSLLKFYAQKAKNKSTKGAQNSATQGSLAGDQDIAGKALKSNSRK